jgi:hypothetical protein
MKEYLIPDKPYKVLKWGGLIALPATAAFVGTVGPAWGWPNVDSVVLTLNAAGVLIGALIGVSTATSKQVDEGKVE